MALLQCVQMYDCLCFTFSPLLSHFLPSPIVPTTDTALKALQLIFLDIFLYIFIFM